MTDEPLRLPEQITLRYRFAAGRFASRFFTTLRNEQRLLARRCPSGHVLLPPRPVCGLCNVPTTDWVEVGPNATLGGFTVVYVPFTDPMTGEGRPVPYGFGLIRFDGCDTNVYHLIDETDPDKLSIGLPVEPVWREPPERTGSLADIRHFRPRRSRAPQSERRGRPRERREQLISEQKIDLPYRYAVGAQQRSFLRGLAEGRLLASTGGDERYVPARPFAPDGRRLEELEEVPPRGRVVAATTARHRPGAPVFGLVLIDGCERPMLHLLEAELPAGTAVEAVFEQDAEPGIRALRHFRCAS